MKNSVYLHISESESSRTRECRNSLLGKNSGLGQMPRTELCSLLSESLETQSLKRPILDFLPVQICLVPKAVFPCLGEDQHTDIAQQPESHLF